jgi:hypothetical protein
MPIPTPIRLFAQHAVHSLVLLPKGFVPASEQNPLIVLDKHLGRSTLAQTRARSGCVRQVRCFSGGIIMMCVFPTLWTLDEEKVVLCQSLKVMERVRACGQLRVWVWAGTRQGETRALVPVCVYQYQLSVYAAYVHTKNSSLFLIIDIVYSLSAPLAADYQNTSQKATGSSAT